MKNSPPPLPEIEVYPPSPAPRIQRRLQRDGLWPFRQKTAEFSTQAPPNQQILAAFIKRTLSALERSPSISTEPKIDYLTAQFSANIAYALLNHWEEFPAYDETRLLEFIERINLIPTLENYLTNHLKIAPPTELPFRVFRVLLLLKIKITSNARH